MAYGILKHRRGTTEDWLASKLVPEEGELIIEECSNGARKCKVGDGIHEFNKLVYIDADTRSFLLTKLAELEKTLYDKIGEAGSDQSQQIVLVKQELEQLTAALSNAVVDYDNKINESKTILQELIKESYQKHLADLAAAKKLIEQKLTISDEKHTKSINDLSNKLSDADSALNESLAQLKQQTEAQDADILRQLDDIYTKTASLAENDAALITKIYAVENSTTSLIKSLTADIADLSEKHDNDSAKLSNNILTLTNKQLSDKAELLDLISNQITNIYTKLEKLVDNDVAIITKIYAVENTFNAKLKNFKETVEREFSDSEAAVNIKINSLKTEVANDFTEVRADIVKNKEDALQAISELSDSIDTVEQTLTEDLETLNSETEQKLNKLQKAIDDQALNFGQSLADKLATTEAILTEKLDTLSSETDQQITDLQTLISEQAIAFEEDLTTTKQELTENVETLRSTTNLKFNDTQKTISQLANTVQDNRTEVLGKIEEVIEQNQVDKEAFEEDLQELKGQLTQTNERINQTNTELDVQTSRITNLIKLKPGSTTGDAELIDIRSGYNGIVHETAGDAVRAIGNDLDELKASLPSYIPANAVDGLEYVDNQLYLTSNGEQVGEAVTITGGGGGGSISTVKIKNNLAATTFTIAKGNEAWIDFTYTSFENEVPTGDGSFSININNKTIEALSGVVQHNVAKRINVACYLKSGANTVKVTCSDQYGASRSLVYNISVIELKIESSFDSTRIYVDTITFRYKVFGQIEKTAYVLIDGEEFSSKKISASVNGGETTLVLPKQAHGCHKITAYLTATINEAEIISNILEYEIICIEENENEALIASVYNITEVTQGDLISIPYIVYDPVSITSNINLIVYSKVAGELIEIDRTPITVGREQQFWNTRKYPNGIAVFTISYTYNLYGEQTTVTKSHTVNVTELEVDVYPEEDSMQLYLSAQGRSNNEQNPGVWTFTQAPDGDKTYEPVTTSFEGFNWTSNGWITDSAGDTCLRLNGDAKAIINFRPFAEDFKANGKTIEFEFVVRDVNDRDAIVIDCFDGDRGFRATPDTAFLKSSGTEVSCRYKDNERIRVAITVEHSDTTSRFVSIYLDGILSGIQRYADTDNFQQNNPLTITLGSSLCGLDIYNIRIYSKALSTAAALNNYIADQTVPSTRLQLMTDNDIFENDVVSYDRVKALGQIPIITFTGPMPTYKGDKKKKTTRMKFEDPAHPEMNFDVLLDQIDVQGTSSQFYIRKNWKVKLPEARAHMPGAIPAQVYCIKVDYAEATGTHNTGAANYVETLYDREKVTLPPQKDDTRVRTTIQGFPVVLFEKETEDSEPVFSSKGNFNYDKDAENAFGFTEAYDSYGVECWEFCNNTSDSVNFTGELAADWLEDFEPRYVPESANFERIEELKEIEELAASGKGTMTEAQRTELASAMSHCIANFKEMHDWVLSTATYTIVDGKKVAITPVPLDVPVTYGETTYTEDNEEYRLAKFKYEFKDYFNMHYSSMYYVFTFFALMTDQRAKNLFLTRWKEDDGVYRWYPYFYDNDTIFGINNEGALVFDYFHEDTDQLGSSNVYNGQNSVLWNNFRLCFPKEIEDTYSELRSSGKLTYSKIIEQFVTNGSDKWSAAIYNADADYKYVSMAREHVAHKDENGNEVTGVDASNLYQVRGNGEQHLRYFINNRINYCDSKWYAGDYPSDDIFLRIYTPKPADNATQEETDRINASLAAVPADPSITVTPFSDMYAGVKYRANGTLQQQRLKAGESYTFKPLNENETFSDTETAIYGAGEMSSLGDLSGLYCGVINLSNAAKLTELTIGNADPAYYNDNFREISVGSNRLLRFIDLRNCAGLGIAGQNPQKTLELSGCPNIEYIYTEGTNLTSVDLPTSGYIKVLHLPASINTLFIKNQHYLYQQSGTPGTESFRDGLFVEDYKNIKTLCIENCPNLNTNELLDKCRDTDGNYTVERIRLTGVEWGTAEEPLTNADFVKSLFNIRGIDENNDNLEDAYLVGTCYIDKLSGDEYAEIKSHYPYLEIGYNEMTSNVIFMDIDGETELYRTTVTGKNSVAPNCEDPVLTNKIEKPVKESTDEFDFEWNGWTRRLGEDKHADALLSIAGDRILYPAFSKTRRKYEVTFINPTMKENSILQVVLTEYGSDAIYTGETPVKHDVDTPELYAFTGWYPKPEKIVGPTTCYAQFTILDSVWYTVGIGDFGEYVSNNTVYVGHTLNSDGTVDLTKYNNYLNAAIIVPNELEVSDTSYSVKRVGGFSAHTELVFVRLPEILTTLFSQAFYGCEKLSEITLPDSLQSIGTNAFRSCDTLEEVTIPINVVTINDGAFSDCQKLSKIVVADGNTSFAMLDDCLVDIQNKRLIQGLPTSKIPQDGSVLSLGRYCFEGVPITSIKIPDGMKIIENNAFSKCTYLQTVELSSSILELGDACFWQCKQLSKIDLPDSITSIRTYVFNECALTDVVLPTKLNNLMEKSFGNLKTLKSVTFRNPADKLPDFIHSGAFDGTAGTEDDPIVFNFPWSEEQHYAKYAENPSFGATYYTLNFDYKETN